MASTTRRARKTKRRSRTSSTSTKKEQQTSAPAEQMKLEDDTTSKSVVNQAKNWWETDTAKVVATVIAVLLVPALIIGWNSYSQNTGTDQASDSDIYLESDELQVIFPEDMSDQLQGKGISMEVDTTETAQDTQEMNDNGDQAQQVNDEAETNENEVANADQNNNSGESESNNSDSDNANSEEKEEKSTFRKVLGALGLASLFGGDENTEETTGAEFEVTADEDTAATESDATDDEGKTAGSETNLIGGLNTLPNASSYYEYVVEKGDTVYSISQEVCEDDSFYISQMNSHRLKVGETLKVKCE